MVRAVILASLVLAATAGHSAPVPVAVSQAPVTTTTQAAPDAGPLARSALDALVANESAKVEAQFTPQMTAALPPGRLAAIWAGLANKAGSFKSCSPDSKVVRIDDKQMVITPCQFAWAVIDVQFAFDTAGRIAGLTFRPGAIAAAPYTMPPYADTAAFTEQDVTVGSGEWALPGTLTVPTGAGPWPAVVLVHGSGPNDRDETVGANRPFKDLAVGLSSRGIAVLRYDKRSKVHAGKLASVKDFTVQQEVIDDAREAVRALRAHPKIDAARIVVLGHSLGGMLVPRIAAAEPALAGLIVLAGPARPLEEAMLGQVRHLAQADGTLSAEEKDAISKTEALGDEVRRLTPADAASGRMIGGAPASYWLDLRGYDPVAAAAAVKRPLLVLQGERDYQVTMDEFAKWKAALGSRPQVTLRSYPTLNHLFISGSGPGLPAEYQVPGHVAVEVVRDIAEWIRNTGR